MFRAKTLAIATAALGLLAAPALAAPADGRASTGFRLKARVPIACWVRPAGAVEAATGAAGSVIEACNAPGGFTVSASYRPLDPAETAQIVYGGARLDLSRSGEQLLRRSNMAAIRTIDYRFDQVTLDQPLVLALTIQPI